MSKTTKPGGKVGMKKMLKTVLTIIATTTIATTMSIGTANAGVVVDSQMTSAGAAEAASGKGSNFPSVNAKVNVNQNAGIQSALKNMDIEARDVHSYGDNNDLVGQGKGNREAGKAGQENKENVGLPSNRLIPAEVIGNSSQKISQRSGHVGTKVLSAPSGPTCRPPSAKTQSKKVTRGDTEYLILTTPVKQLDSVDTGLDPSLTGDCSVQNSPGPGGGTYEQKPVVGAYIQVNASDSKLVTEIAATTVKPGVVECIYEYSDGYLGNKKRESGSETRYVKINSIAKNSYKPEKLCETERPMFKSTVSAKITRRAKKVITANDISMNKMADRDIFEKCETDNSIKFPETRSGTATFGKREPAKELPGGTLSNAPLNGKAGFFNGCLYDSVNRNAKMTSYFKAWMKCVVDVKYGPGKTLAGQVWDTSGAKKQTVYKTDYGNNLDSFSMCTKTFDETFPKPGEAELMPTSASGNLLGRYYNHLSWTLDDPDLDITGCKISLDGAPCTPEKIRIAKHNYSYKTAHFMVRQTCSSRANKNGNTMSNIWWRNYNYDNSNIGVETPFGDVHSAKYDMFEGRKLTYTLNDCSTNNTPFGDRFYCAANPNGVGGMDSVASNQVVPRSNVEAPSETDTLAENRLNLENNSAYRKYLGLYSMPSRSGQPLETRWIDEKTGTQSINVTGREAIEQKNNAYINGLSLVRNGLPKSYRWELPIVTSENVNSKMFPVARPSNLRVTGNYVLVRKGGTPFVNTPKSRSIWNINPQGNLTSNQPHYTQNPFLPPEYENGKHKRENGYYDNGRGQIQEYGGASNLDFNLISPKTGQTYDRLVPAGAARQEGNELYHRWNNYHIYKLDTPNANVLMSSKWLSSSGQPLYVAPASEITGQFPVLFAYLQYISPNASFYSNGFNVTQIQNGKLLCIGPDTIVSSYRANN